MINQFRQDPVIEVGILTAQQIKFELYGVFHVAGFKEPFSGVYTAQLIDGIITCKGQNNKFEVLNEIIFEPVYPVSESFIIRDVIIGLKFHWERKEKLRFNNTLKIIKDGENIVAINVIPLEQYLVSVISSEMSAKCSIEMLKSQAVVARSWLLSQMSRSKNQNIKNLKKETSNSENEIIKWYDREDHILYDVCADDHCQRFQGVTKISSEGAREAVKISKGIVLVSDQQICDTRYAKCCGGITENFENVWEPVHHSYLKAIVDYKFEPENFDYDFTNEDNVKSWILENPPAYCNTSDDRILKQILIDYDRETKDFYRWKITLTQKEITKIINSKSGINFGNILDLIPVERGKSGRLIKLKIVGSEKTMIVGKELEIRRLLSESHLYSSAIYIEKSKEKIPEQFTIYGAGWGHGVGLCQIGAAVMAEKGYRFDEILLHYFSGADLKRIY